MAISEDLRIRLVKKVASGMSRRRAAAYFEVSASSAVRYVKRYQDKGTVAVKSRPPRKRRLDPYSEDILDWIKETPDLTFIPGLRCDGLTAPWVIDGPMTGDIFQTYMETQLAPTLQKGHVVILD
ncbi:MAG: hypothetical protein COA43_16570 [Robiginitomaculum sp.]|nr:MAG: hypothetical protein COA43_16570 [Robiginitomaculum sp.]